MQNLNCRDSRLETANSNTMRTRSRTCVFLTWKTCRSGSEVDHNRFRIMRHTHQSLISFAFLVICASGCDQSGPSPSQVSSAERQQLLDAVAQAEREAQNTVAPEPNIALVTPHGWTRTETRALPTDDHGFTVAYEHESGLAVTLYQFTRGLTSIPNDVNASPVKEAMKQAKRGIEQASQLGYWQAAKETESKTVLLGDSQQQALWSQYHLTVDEMVLASDIYVWARSNTLFKIRCTARSEDVASNQAVLGPLLTAFGLSAVAADN